MIDLSDGSYSTTKIYPAFPGHPDVLVEIGDFYVQFAGSLCAYDLPGGAMAMEFTDSNTIEVPDGSGGTYVQGTFELDVPQANGEFRPFKGGHNRMVDNLHLLASPPGGADEFCVCLITRPVQRSTLGLDLSFGGEGECRERRCLDLGRRAGRGLRARAEEGHREDARPDSA